jgi:DNA-binding beta-propeller fold protein YncE
VTAFRAALVAVVVLAAAAPAGAATRPPMRDVLVVSNNWDGTADFIDTKTFKRVKRLNIIPDAAEREAEIQSDPQDLGYYLAIRELVGEGHHQYVDDSFTSPDGRYLYVSRPSFADVVAIDLKTDKIVWRTQVEGNRADHMAISRNGRRLLVSASTARKVHEIDTKTGKIRRSFESGDQPHENNYSADGRTIFHASIGTVYTPTDDPALDDTKGDRWFQVVDNRTFEVKKRIDMGAKLEEAGYPDQSATVRPMALSPSERYLYFQISFFHGFVEYDLKKDKVLRVKELPDRSGAGREEYLLDSAHHGLAMNPRGTKLCAAGTMSDYAAIVVRRSFKHKIIPVGEKPYWATNSADGRYCFVSVSGEDRVSVISYRRAREVRRIRVGDHPQRMRTGRVRSAYLRRR